MAKLHCEFELRMVFVFAPGLPLGQKVPKQHFVNPVVEGGGEGGGRE